MKIKKTGNGPLKNIHVTAEKLFSDNNFITF